MKDVEVELRRVMREHAAALTSAPPLLSPLPERRRGARLGRGRRRALIVPVAAALGLGAGVALSQVLDEPEPITVTPVTERFVVAVGETNEGPWQLTAYRAQVSVPRWTGTEFRQEVGMARCLDLDGPGIEEPGAPSTQRMNACTFEAEGELIEPIGASTRVPEFREDEALLYGEVSLDVVSVEVGRDRGLGLQATIVRAPEELNLPVEYFFAFVPGRGKVDVVARGESGEVLEKQRI